MRKTKITIEELGDGGYHIFCKGRVNGVITRMLVDTGASKTVISSKLREQMTGLEDVEVPDSRTAGIGQEQMEATFVNLGEVSVAGVVLTNLVAGVIPLDHVETMYNGLGIQPFQVILGGDFLAATRAVIDYRKKELRLTTP